MQSLSFDSCCPDDARGWITKQFDFWLPAQVFLWVFQSCFWQLEEQYRARGREHPEQFSVPSLEQFGAEQFSDAMAAVKLRNRLTC